MAYGVSLYLVTRTGTDATSHDDVAFASQLGNLVLVIGEVGGQLPLQVLCLDGTHGECSLDTLVLQRTDIAQHLVTEVRTCRNGGSVDQVGGLTIIVVYATADAVAEQGEVQTDVRSCGGLPLQVLVIGIGTVEQTAVVEANEGITSVHTGGVHVIGGKIIVVADAVLLTGLTPTETELQLVKPFGVLQEGLFVDLPTKCYRGEGCPVVVETAGTVATYGGGNHVAVESDVVGTSEERYQVALLLPLAGAR